MRARATKHIKGNLWLWTGGFAAAGAAALALGGGGGWELDAAGPSGRDLIVGKLQRHSHAE